MSIYIHDEITHNYKAAEKILPEIIQKYNIKSVLDIGTGIGTWLKVAELNGVNDIIGIDGSWVNKDLLKISKKYFLEQDLTERINLKRKFDLIICLEVAEHLPEKSASNLVDTICKHGDLILFSAAIPGQGGQNHINEQPPQYWYNLFKSKGYEFYDYVRPHIWNNSDIEWWYRQNIFLISKGLIEPLFIDDNLVNSYIHPELFYSKYNILNIKEKELELYKNAKMNPKIYLKAFFKSIINFFIK